jgi:hypothetical protein
MNWTMLVGVVIAIPLCIIVLFYLWAWNRNARSDGKYRQAITSAERQMRPLVHRYCADATVSHFGVPFTDPRNLTILVTTLTDNDRDYLRNDPSLERLLRATLAPSGYPQDAAPLVKFRFESKETIRRDFGGNWYNAMNS